MKRLKRNITLFFIAFLIFFLSFSMNFFSLLSIVKGEKVLLTNDNNLSISYSNIQDAIDNASNNDTILVDIGIYYENLIINKSINLVGADKYNTIIDGNEKLYTIFLNECDINISGFTIRNCEVGIYIIGPNSYNINITNNIIEKSDEGLTFYNSSDNQIKNNIFSYHRSRALNLCNSSYNLIKNNSFFSNYRSICLVEHSDNNSLFSNNITSRESGLLLDFSNFNVISSNIIHKGNHGIRLIYSDNNSITENIIKDHDYYGIFLSKSYYNIIKPNIFSNNKQDIKVEINPPTIKASDFEFLFMVFFVIVLLSIVFFYKKSKLS